MRPARGGAYLIVADNPAISENVYNVFHRQEWNEKFRHQHYTILFVQVLSIASQLCMCGRTRFASFICGVYSQA